MLTIACLEAGREILVAALNGQDYDVPTKLAELRSLGHDVTTAADGLEAFARASERPFTLALLDIGMPGMNGYDVARNIRREPWGSGIYLVALTGWGQDEDRAEARAAGFDDHMTKPIDLESLLRVFDRVKPRATPAAGTIPS